MQQQKQSATDLMAFLREYQKTAIEQIRTALRAGKKRPILVAPTAFGKTITAAAIIKAFLEKNPGKVAMFLAPRRELIYQTVAEFEALDIQTSMIMASEPLGYSMGRCKVASIDTLLARCIRSERMQLPMADMIIVDECFPGYVEILTSDGFKRFDSLDKSLKVAQYEGGVISFVEPIRHVEKSYSGALVRLYSDKLIDLPMTPNHELLVRWHMEKNEPHDRKVTATSINFNACKKMYVAGYASGEDSILSPADKLMIALQADGCVVENAAGTKILQFQFSKQRKIDAFISLMAEGGFRYSEVKGVAARGGRKAKRRFLVKDIDYGSKVISKFFDLASMSFIKAKAIIEYMVLWDGHINSRGGYYYSNTDECAVDFYQEVCVLAGYKTNKTLQVDKRSETYSNMHRLNISKINTVGCQNIKKEIISYEGSVYCVTVPSGNIVVRHKGFVTVVGNCHLMVSTERRKVIDAYPEALIIGVTATPALPNNGSLGEVFDELVMTHDIRQLTQDKFLAPLRYFGGSCADLSMLKLNKDDNYQAKQLGEVMDNPGLIGDIYQNWKRIAGGKQTVIFCVSCDHARHVYNLFLAYGVKAEYVDGKTEKQDRKERLARIESRESQVLVNCQIATYGLNIPCLECCVLATPSRSLRDYIQRVGRVLRICKGKKEAILIDHAGAIEMHGRVDDFIPWSLDGTTTVSERKEALAKEAKEPKDITCKQCHRVFRGTRICPACGFEMVPKGKPVPCHQADLVEIKEVKSKKPTAAEKARWWAELVGYCRRNSKPDRFALAMFRNKFNEWPKKKNGVGPLEPSIEVINYVRSRNIAYAKGMAKNVS